MKKKLYKKELYRLQVELVKFQKYVIEENVAVCIVLEGRDTAGKDGTIKRFIEHLSPREARTVALGIPSDKEKNSWYFQRYVPHLPSGGEIVFFNRSWYNRAGVEKVMGFCTKKQYEAFMEEVGSFEEMLTHSNIRFFKYYLDISQKEQKKRLEARKTDPLKQWKLSPIDAKAQKMWNAYSKTRDEMFNKTSFVYAPWYVVHTDDKKEARINIIKHFLSLNDYPDKDKALLAYDHDVICKFDPVCYEKGMIAP
ncbi:polyphosphate kinase 2 [Sulfurovum sp.]|uniref:polyphosphate kinase 2 n=1 Tax=Sulfurovum sp. TaxID=1969726 RepID=UPI0025D61880|nr:polyphosphate kinase 2 [Sulfurovum sp.]